MDLLCHVLPLGAAAIELVHRAGAGRESGSQTHLASCLPWVAMVTRRRFDLFDIEERRIRLPLRSTIGPGEGTDWTPPGAASFPRGAADSDRGSGMARRSCRA